MNTGKYLDCLWMAQLHTRHRLSRHRRSHSKQKGKGDHLRARRGCHSHAYSSSLLLTIHPSQIGRYFTEGTDRFHFVPLRFIAATRRHSSHVQAPASGCEMKPTCHQSSVCFLHLCLSVKIFLSSGLYLHQKLSLYTQFGPGN